ncbi:B3 domain-containing protein At3g06220-like [Momordica charantia]|uniref:B3 domain-containing protein At3g06220-like n=1 Tax=Momordica charantia TaxID=3673 RepID=A0A6J1BX56_MOMCH|nr:B3 domain-containing protein At3g06220-like [Momordica charantia]
MEPSSRISSCPEFFKVFLPNSSSQHMCIPPAFVEHFNGSVPSNAVLRDHSGKSWDVTLEELKNGVFFKNGWREFADYHLLKYGDFLVFQYDGSHMFDVKIFGKNGCKKELVSGNGSCFPDVKIKDEPQSEQDCSSKSLTGCERNGLEVRSSGSSGTAPKSREISTTNLEELCPSKTTDHISKKRPTFKHVVKRWTCSAIQISKKMVVANNILLKPTVVLINEMGKSWPVTAKPLSRRRFGLTTGWSVFFKENRLKMNDKCTFEFVRGRNNICGEIIVKITRRQARARCEK